METIHAKPVKMDYVADPAKQVVGYRNAPMTAEQEEEGLSRGDIILPLKAKTSLWPEVICKTKAYTPPSKNQVHCQECQCKLLI